MILFCLPYSRNGTASNSIQALRRQRQEPPSAGSVFPHSPDKDGHGFVKPQTLYTSYVHRTVFSLSHFDNLVNSDDTKTASNFKHLHNYYLSKFTSAHNLFILLSSLFLRPLYTKQCGNRWFLRGLNSSPTSSQAPSASYELSYTQHVYLS